MAGKGTQGLKSEQKRRLAAEQAIYRKGYANFKSVTEDCIRYCEKHKLDVTFNTLAVQQFIGCQTNLSMKRLEILCKVLDITNYAEFAEIYTAPKRRGEGGLWVGTNGNTVKDIDLGAIPDRL